MKLANGRPLIEILLKRLSNSKAIDRIVLATSERKEDDLLVQFVGELGFDTYRGSETDVLDRYYNAALKYQCDTVVRITGDCPLVDSKLVDEIIYKFRSTGVDYASNIDPPTWPDGLDVEVFSFDALGASWREATDPFCREHVTPFMRSTSTIKKVNLVNEQDLSDNRWTVDQSQDLLVIQNIIEYFEPDIYFGWNDVLKLVSERPEYCFPNREISRNEGARRTSGQKLWARAKAVIPGGNMLLSKRPEMFLPDRWPTYFSKAKGCEVWDLDGTHLIDFSMMGVGTNILGYGHPEVDQAVKQAIGRGNMSTLNCPEEVLLAERLVELHPWSDMVRLARTGGEANAIAVRIARAASGRDKVAVCGYHGWHDWYLAANLRGVENLETHLLPGLQPAGVPKGLHGTVMPFRYNCFDQLESLVKKNPDIGVIKMEVARSEKPTNEFLQNVRSLATDSGIVLIFDECTTGFRQTYGGLHKKYGVDPDIAIFGKALGNGYAITAILGRREVMEAAQETFISSTFWTERIGPAAALKTLEVMGKLQSWLIISATGQIIRDGWADLANKHQLSIIQQGLPAIASFVFKSDNALAYKTLITQEMLKKGFLATNAIYACTEHGTGSIQQYFTALDEVFSQISECEEGRNIHQLLEVPVCESGFTRLN
jgi:glutamate-1-semialdehyde 2,1-aminomutase